MEKLLRAIRCTMDGRSDLPFSVYSSSKEQNLLNVPIVKPLLIVVLSGSKELGKDSGIVCHTGNFIFLSDSPSLDIRNIPNDREYFALLIEFDEQDYGGLPTKASNKQQYCIGKTTSSLEECLRQFVESALWSPKSLWSLRKREILGLLCHMGHTDILAMMGHSKMGHRIHDLFCQQSFHELTIEHICHQLAMSESTLRRRLKSEGTSVQAIKDQARLGLGLHLLQTTQDSIGLIAETCGYQSQSRFTDRFKGRFGLTPSELRNTRMMD